MSVARATNAITMLKSRSRASICLSRLNLNMNCRWRLRHFVDNQPALRAIVKGSSKQVDLNSLVGSVWYTCANRLASYWGQYVRSKSNLADGPSRRDYRLVKQLGAQEVPFEYGKLYDAAEKWLSHPLEATLV